MSEKFTGNLPVQVHSTKAWLQHDHAQHWSDGGQIRQAVDALVAALEGVVADETKAAVLDYASSAEMALGVSPAGELLVGVRMSNSDAHVAVSIGFRELVLNALKEIRPNLGTDPGAQALLSAMISVARALSQVLAPPVEERQSGVQQPLHQGLNYPGNQKLNVPSTPPKRPTRNPPPVAGA